MKPRGRPPYPDVLTAREWEVFYLLRMGLTNQEIAEWLGISFHGAKYHVSEVLTKLGLDGREEVAALTAVPRVVMERQQGIQASHVDRVQPGGRVGRPVATLIGFAFVATATLAVLSMFLSGGRFGYVGPALAGSATLVVVAFAAAVTRVAARRAASGHVRRRRRQGLARLHLPGRG